MIKKFCSIKIFFDVAKTFLKFYSPARMPARSFLLRTKKTKKKIAKFSSNLIIFFFLVIDMAPGTGYAQISLSQAVPISGAIVVTTPQQVTLQDARRGLAMFKQLGVPLLGIVENMSVFIPPDMPGKKYEIFGKGGGQTLANENDLPLLAQIPIEIPLVDDSNKGVPISISQPNIESSIVFGNLAQLIKNQFVDS